MLRYRALLRTDRFGKLRVVLPKQLSGRGLTVSLRGQWTHSGVTRRS